MESSKKYEILDSLPVYGPMYIPVSQDGINFYHEGFVVRFFQDDGTNWVGNFKTGWTKYSNVFEIPQVDKIVVIANGQGYIMTTEQQKPVETFGYAITEVISVSNNRFIAADIIDLKVIESNGGVWNSERISWDGIINLSIKDNIISGLSFDPLDSSNEWVPFTFNLDTKELIGGSYKRYSIEKVKKSFWKFW